MVALQEIGFQEGELLVKTLCEKNELEEAYRLRHKVFSQNLKWVPSSEDELEVDPYDALATSVGLISGSGKVVRHVSPVVHTRTFHA